MHIGLSRMGCNRRWHKYPALRSIPNSAKASSLFATQFPLRPAAAQDRIGALLLPLDGSKNGSTEWYRKGNAIPSTLDSCMKLICASPIALFQQRRPSRAREGENERRSSSVLEWVATRSGLRHNFIYSRRLRASHAVLPRCPATRKRRD